ncbi:MAG: dTDP-4-dehydrorhamnose reductase [Myxococcales bacterium]|nr:dTDP-4-dehydrorhamnose reductase [Myxococcales bacterium]
MDRRSRMLVLGCRGMLGTTALRHFAARYEMSGRDLPEIDITQPASIEEALRDESPDVVLNCAAYTAVDDCESQPERADSINGVAPGLIAKACDAAGALLVQISTDYVFDGRQQRPYIESDATGPLSVYGRSKLRGEQEVRAVGGAHLIARTAWLYGPGGRNFVETISRLLTTQPALRIVDDQHGSPTSTFELCRQIEALLATSCRGTYHTVCDGTCSWYDFALAIAAARQSETPIAPCSTGAFPRPAPRPASSRLSTEKLQRDTDYRPTHWRAALTEYMEERWRPSS